MEYLDTIIIEYDKCLVATFILLNIAMEIFRIKKNYSYLNSVKSYIYWGLSLLSALIALLIMLYPFYDKVIFFPLIILVFVIYGVISIVILIKYFGLFDNHIISPHKLKFCMNSEFQQDEIKEKIIQRFDQDFYNHINSYCK